METRYYNMIMWAIEYLIFSYLIIELYSYLNKSLKTICIRYKTKVVHIYLQDLIVLFLLIAVVGIRCNCGSDYYNYYNMYSNSLRWYSNIYSIFAERFQNGYMLICYLTQLMGGNEFTVFGVVAVITYIPIFWIFRNYSKNPVVSFSLWILLGYFAMTLNILKQTLAMSFVFLAYICYIKERKILFVFFSIMGCFFHVSVAYVLVILLLSKKIKPSMNLLYFSTLLGMFLLTLFEPFIKIVSFILPSRYSSYINAYVFGDINEFKLQIGGIFVCVFYIVLIFVIMKKRINNQNRNKLEDACLTACILCVPFLLMSIRYYLFNRVAYTGLQFVTIVIPFYFIQINNKMKKISIIYLIIFCFCFSILCAENNYYNYSTIFNDKPMPIRDFVIKHQ